MRFFLLFMYHAFYSIFRHKKFPPQNVLGDKFILSRGKITGLVENSNNVRFYLLEGLDGV